MSEDEEAKQGSKLLVVVCLLVAGIGGYAIARYTGSAIWIPGAAALLIGVLFHQSPIKPPHFKVSVALIGAQFVWMFTGAALMGGWSQVQLDLGYMAAGIIWIWWKPGWFPMLLLALFQSYGLAMNAITFADLEIGTIEHKAITVHLTFRCCSVVALIWELVAWRQARRAAISTTSDTETNPTSEEKPPVP